MASLLTIDASATSGARALTVGARCSASMSPGTVAPPTIPRSQSYIWTPEWQQWEMLADYNRMTGACYEPEDAEDLIRWLNADD